MVRTYHHHRSQQQTADDTPANKQSIANLQAQIATLVTTVTNLITQRTAPAIRRERHKHGGNNGDAEGNKNSFTPVIQQYARCLNNKDSDLDEEYEDLDAKFSNTRDNENSYVAQLEGPIFDVYNTEEEEENISEHNFDPIFDRYDDEYSDKDNNALFDEQSVVPIYDLYDDEMERVTVDRVEDQSQIFDRPIYDTETLTLSQSADNSASILSHEDFTSSNDVTWNHYFKDTFTSLRTLSTASDQRKLFFWLSRMSSEKEDQAEDIILDTLACAQFFEESGTNTYTDTYCAIWEDEIDRQISKEPPDHDYNNSMFIHRENSVKLLECLMFLKKWFTTTHSYVSYTFCDVIVIMAQLIDLKSANNHNQLYYGEEIRSSCEGLFAWPVMQRKCEFDDKQFDDLVLLVELVSVRSHVRFCWGRLGENMLLLTPEDPMIVFASLHVSDSIGLKHLVLFSSGSAFHFELDDCVLKPLLYLRFHIFSRIMAGNAYVSTQQGCIIERFSSQVKPAILTAHFILQATLSFFNTAVKFWDERDLPTSCYHQLFDISKCANLCVDRGKYKIYSSWDSFFSIVVSYTDPLVNLLEVKLVKVLRATHFLLFRRRRMCPFELYMSYVLLGDAKYMFVWPTWTNKKVSTLLYMLLMFVRGDSPLQLGSQCRASTRRLRTITLIVVGFSYKGPYFLILQKDVFGSVVLISDDLPLAEMPYRARKYIMVYGHLLYVFQHLSRGCLRIRVAFTYWQSLVPRPSLYWLSLIVWLIKTKPDVYKKTSDEHILLLPKMVKVFPQRERGTEMLESLKTSILFWCAHDLQCGVYRLRIGDVRSPQICLHDKFTPKKFGELRYLCFKQVLVGVL